MFAFILNLNLNLTKLSIFIYKSLYIIVLDSSSSFIDLLVVQDSVPINIIKKKTKQRICLSDKQISLTFSIRIKSTETKTKFNKHFFACLCAPKENHSVQNFLLCWQFGECLMQGLNVIDLLRVRLD